MPSNDLAGDTEFTLKRGEKPMSVWADSEHEAVVVKIGDDVRYLDANDARDMAVGFENHAEQNGEDNDELHQAGMLRRAARQIDGQE